MKTGRHLSLSLSVTLCLSLTLSVTVSLGLSVIRSLSPHVCLSICLSICLSALPVALSHLRTARFEAGENVFREIPPKGVPVPVWRKTEMEKG